MASTTGKPAIAEDAGGESTGRLAPYWRSGDGGRLTLPHCAGCDHLFWPPADVCPECLAGTIDWRSVDGAGTVWSVAVYHHAYTAATAAAVPYQCILVELDCGPRMISRFVPSDAAAAPGQRVVATRAAMVPDGPMVPCFQEGEPVGRG